MEKAIEFLRWFVVSEAAQGSRDHEERKGRPAEDQGSAGKGDLEQGRVALAGAVTFGLTTNNRNRHE
jgi:hypothetical protein